MSTDKKPDSCRAGPGRPLDYTGLHVHRRLPGERRGLLGGRRGDLSGRLFDSFTRTGVADLFETRHVNHAASAGSGRRRNVGSDSRELIAVIRYLIHTVSYRGLA